MGICEREGVCLAVSGYEEDYLDFAEPGSACGIAELVEQAAGMESPRWDVLTAFELVQSSTAGRDTWSTTVADYQAETGRKWPPVYRVKIRVEAEALSDEETEVFWLKRQAWLDDAD